MEIRVDGNRLCIKAGERCCVELSIGLDASKVFIVGSQEAAENFAEYINSNDWKIVEVHTGGELAEALSIATGLRVYNDLWRYGWLLTAPQNSVYMEHLSEILFTEALALALRAAGVTSIAMGYTRDKEERFVAFFTNPWHVEIWEGGARLSSGLIQPIRRVKAEVYDELVVITEA